MLRRSAYLCKDLVFEFVSLAKKLIIIVTIVITIQKGIVRQRQLYQLAITSSKHKIIWICQNAFFFLIYFDLSYINIMQSNFPIPVRYPYKLIFRKLPKIRIYTYYFFVKLNVFEIWKYFEMRVSTIPLRHYKNAFVRRCSIYWWNTIISSLTFVWKTSLKALNITLLLWLLHRFEFGLHPKQYDKVP